MTLSENVIELDGISKCYKKTKVIDGVNLKLERGHILGLLGPNGAGKTTILKLLAGLVAPDEGKLSFFGSEQRLDTSRKKLSFLIEEPALDPLMTAKENLKYVCYIKDIKNANEKIRDILSLVGLCETGKKQVKEFSLGMKQRLGIGIALLSGPEVLILDEPMNGLDPEGIMEIRYLIKELAEKRKVTIMISSHILSELEEICTDYAILNCGKLIVSASREELVRISKRQLVIVVNDVEKTCNMLEKKYPTIKYQVSHKGEVVLDDFQKDISSILKDIVDEGISVSKFSCEGEGLEHFYLSKVGAV